MWPANYSMKHGRKVFVTNIFLKLSNLLCFSLEMGKMYFSISATFPSRSKAEK